MGVITRISPDIVILDIGTNDLALAPPEVVGSDIEELVRSLVAEYSVRAVVLCQVTPLAPNKSSNFNERAKLLNQYTRVVIEPIKQAICWTHRGFSNPSVTSGVAKGGRGGASAPPIAKKNSLKKAKSVEKLGGGGGYTLQSSKLIKYVSTEENDDILEELDL